MKYQINKRIVYIPEGDVSIKEGVAGVETFAVIKAIRGDKYAVMPIHRSKKDSEYNGVWSLIDESQIVRYAGRLE